MNLKVFNKENDVTYIGQGIGYTQGVGISYEVDFDTFKELVNKIFKKAKLDRAPKTTTEIHDSSLEDDNIFIKSKKEDDKKKKTEPTTPNKEAVPGED